MNNPFKKRKIVSSTTTLCSYCSHETSDSGHYFPNTCPMEELTYGSPYSEEEIVAVINEYGFISREVAIYALSKNNGDLALSIKFLRNLPIGIYQISPLFVGLVAKSVPGLSREEAIDAIFRNRGASMAAIRDVVTFDLRSKET